MTKIKTFLIILALPWIFLWGVIVSGFDMFRGNSGHTAGLCAGFLMLGAIFAAVVGLIELGLAALILFAIFH